MLKVNRLKALLALTVLGLWAVSSAVADHGGDSKSVTRHHARLTGAAIQGKTPEGSADFRSETARRDNGWTWK